MTAYPQVTIPATEVRTLQSRSVNQQFRISIALPYSYPSSPKKTYPTVYLLDANWYFGLVTDMTRMMSRCSGFPETILVGVGYPVDETLEDAWRQLRPLRTRDLTPVIDRRRAAKYATAWKLDRVRTGGAGKFLRFIKTEVLSTIEAEFRANPAERVLAGHSFGALFVLYALFQQPKLFKGYVASSPSLFWGDNAMLGLERRFAKTHRTLPARLHLSVGGLEEEADSPMVSSMIQLAARLKSRGDRGLSLVAETVDNCNHCASTAPGLQAGLSFVLA